MAESWQKMSGRKSCPFLWAAQVYMFRAFCTGCALQKKKHLPVCGRAGSRTGCRRRCHHVRRTAAGRTGSCCCYPPQQSGAGAARARTLSAPPAKSSANRRRSTSPRNALPQPDLRSGFSRTARIFTAALTCVWTQMLEAGLITEAELVWQNRATFRTAAQAIGYKEFFPYFEQTASWKPARKSSSRPPATTPSAS